MGALNLTTRQYIATQLLAGLMAGDTYEKSHSIKIAIEATDELLRQLEVSESLQKPKIIPERPDKPELR